jgi:hypothetical protein
MNWKMIPARTVVLASLTVLAVLAPDPVAAQTSDPPLSAELETVRATLDRYRDPIAAVHDGYLSSVGCIEYPEGGHEGAMRYVAGGMGVHFLNHQYVGQELDPERPQVLLYEPVGDGLRLVAAEWFVPAELAGAERPRVFDRELDGPMEGHAPLMPAGFHHYDLHVWLWKENPAGVFSPTNPALTCPEGALTFQEEAPRMVPHGHGGSRR